MPDKNTKIKVLVVDDEFVSRETLKVFTKKLGYDVLEAVDGLNALEVWRKERPNIVVTDWNMPKMDGLELCSKIRIEEGDDYTYMIMITARDDHEDVLKGLKAGADEYLAKPFKQEELFARLQSAERVLNLQSKDVVIFALAKLAESRDEDTGSHLDRIRHYSKVIAEYLFNSENCPEELDSQLISNIYLTSPLHDIGKVGIPDFILLKPGRLDDNEFKMMRTHTTIGYETLYEALKQAPKAKYLKVAADIAKHHHEKFDGTGYPVGLSGSEISLVGRIVALADVYDALVSRRPYKEPFTHPRAKAIILEGKGTHFDPMIVDAFLETEDKFIKIHEQFQD